ncbi:hypothetical protein QE394_001006 [Arthrobacter sp. SORGH_AS 212]|uniref:hypothetical protein n=1 Tax=Pseudarthrobacter sp. SORGH_AS 212 TaxID=3041777 RepID=UPI00277EE18E|nr:hypothetical protein [Arthrobacter sp. SORGH_AS_0212]
MPHISVPTLNVYQPGCELLAPGLAVERCVLTPEARASLPKGTITIDADDCHGVADGNDGFRAVGLGGTYPADQSAVLPAYVIAGPDLPTLIPGGGAVLSRQELVDGVRYEFYAIDTAGDLFRWTGLDDLYEGFAWETAGQEGEASPVFPITAWQ